MLVGWFIDENILAPLVRAGALELHPIIVTFAFLLGAQLAGAIGAIVAIPLAAVVQAFVVKYFEQYRAQRGWPGPDDIGAPEDDVGAAGAAAPSELSGVAAQAEAPSRRRGAAPTAGRPTPKVARSAASRPRRSSERDDRHVVRVGLIRLEAMVGVADRLDGVRR